MSRKTPPRKLDISGANTTSLTVPQPHHHQQGIAALFAITFDMRVCHDILQANVRRGVL